jgi:putative chitinase
MVRWAPKANKDYLEAFMKLEPQLKKAGILHHPLMLCHFLGQIGAETNGLTIIRENMNYRSVERIRQVWPARTRKLTDAYIKMNLVGNPVALADFAYGGRMGNKKGTEDGYLYRGGGAMQTTGKAACQKYCNALGISFTPDVLDDVELTWLFAIYEWSSSGCGSYALQNDVLAISKIINTGSARSGIQPNGLDHRKRWLKRAWTVWGEPDRKTVPDVSDLTLEKLKEKGSETLSTSDLIKVGAGGGAVTSITSGAASESGVVETLPKTSTEQVLDGLRQTTESVDVMTSFTQTMKGFWVLLITNWWVFGLCLAVGAYALAKRIDWRRLLDARLGLNVGRLDQVETIDPEAFPDMDDAIIPRG